MTTPLETLRDRLGVYFDVHAALSLMQWDQEVYMPPKAAAVRGVQLATLSGIAHQLHTAPEIGDALKALANDASLSADEKRLVDETRHDYDKATRLPEKFVSEFALAQSTAYEAWTRARKESNFTLFRDELTKMVDLLKRRADYFGYEDTPYDALLGEYERGMTVAQLKPIFAELAEKQKALVAKIVASPNQPDVAWLDDTWNKDAQWAFTMDVLKDMGYDFERGRQDHSVHPFTTEFGMFDVRVTTRVYENELFSALTSSMHEGGHALYEQGFRVEDARTTLAQAPSLGIHESQSRMWENTIGRSLPFWKHYADDFKKLFPGQLDGKTAEDFHRAINVVAPTFIRVESDECTYNLHIILRFEIELDLIEGRMTVDDIPDAWNAKMKDYLGLDVPNDAQGCLQDIHWSHGSMGYFPTYALGNLYAAQLFEQIEADLPHLWNTVENGDFAPLLAWLRENVHQHGRRKTAVEIVEDATGKKASSGPFLGYLERKYGGLYGV